MSGVAGEHVTRSAPGPHCELTESGSQGCEAGDVCQAPRECQWFIYSSFSDIFPMLVAGQPPPCLFTSFTIWSPFFHNLSLPSCLKKLHSSVFKDQNIHSASPHHCPCCLEQSTDQRSFWVTWQPNWSLQHTNPRTPLGAYPGPCLLQPFLVPGPLWHHLPPPSHRTLQPTPPQFCKWAMLLPLSRGICTCCSPHTYCPVRGLSIFLKPMMSQQPECEQKTFWVYSEIKKKALK